MSPGSVAIELFALVVAGDKRHVDARGSHVAAVVEVLPDGTFVTTTYGHWIKGQQPYIVCVRLKLEELDQLADRQKK